MQIRPSALKCPAFREGEDAGGGLRRLLAAAPNPIPVPRMVPRVIPPRRLPWRARPPPQKFRELLPVPPLPPRHVRRALQRLRKRGLQQ